MYICIYIYINIYIYIYIYIIYCTRTNTHTHTSCVCARACPAGIQHAGRTLLTALHVCAQRNALRVPRRLGVAMGADAVICPAGIQHTYRMRRSYPAVTALHVCANPNALRVPRRLGETQRCGAAMGADASMRRGCPPTPPSCPVAHCPGRSCSIRALLTQPRCGRPAPHVLSN